MTLNIKDGVVRRIRTIWKPVQAPQTGDTPATPETPAESVPFQRFMIAFHREGIIPCT